MKRILVAIVLILLLTGAARADYVLCFTDCDEFGHCSTRCY